MKHIMKFSTTTQYQEWKAANPGFSPYFCCCVDTGAKYYQKLINNNGHDYVDLGLPSGTLWATMNIGASNTSDPGSYFAWGETSTKSSYTAATYTLVSNDELSKYTPLDGKARLELEDDAAHVLWGGDWHIPTADQWNELITYYLVPRVESMVIDTTAGTLECGDIIFVAGGVMNDSTVETSGEGVDDEIVLISSDLSDSSPAGCKAFMASDGIVDPPRFFGFNIRPVLGGENYNFVGQPSSLGGPTIIVDPVAR